MSKSWLRCHTPRENWRRKGLRASHSWAVLVIARWLARWHEPSKEALDRRRRYSVLLAAARRFLTILGVLLLQGALGCIPKSNSDGRWPWDPHAFEHANQTLQLAKDRQATGRATNTGANLVREGPLSLLPPHLQRPTEPKNRQNKLRMARFGHQPTNIGHGRLASFNEDFVQIAQMPARDLSATDSMRGTASRVSPPAFSLAKQSGVAVGMEGGLRARTGGLRR